MPKVARKNTLFDSPETRAAALAVARNARQVALIENREPWVTRQNRKAVLGGIDLINRLAMRGFKIACVQTGEGRTYHQEYTIGPKVAA